MVESMNNDMRLSLENENRIKQNNDVISTLLCENEEILRSEGFIPPEKNFSPEKGRIRFPKGYIRSKTYFVDKYALNEILMDATWVSNVAYCLQMSDMNNYIMNRFETYAAIDTMLNKQSFLTIVSVIEALIQGAVTNIRKGCQSCKEKGCPYRIAKNNISHTNEIVKSLNKNGIVHLSEDEITDIGILFSLRNEIHVISSENNVMINNTYNVGKYNKAITLLKKIDDELKINVVPLYGKCMKNEKESQGLTP